MWSKNKQPQKILDDVGHITRHAPTPQRNIGASQLTGDGGYGSPLESELAKRREFGVHKRNLPEEQSEQTKRYTFMTRSKTKLQRPKARALQTGDNEQLQLSTAF